MRYSAVGGPNKEVNASGAVCSPSYASVAARLPTSGMIGCRAEVLAQYGIARSLGASIGRTAGGLIYINPTQRRSMQFKRRDKPGGNALI
jgi:hypothetical protein